MQKPYLKNPAPQPSGTIVFLGLAQLSLEVFSLFSPSLSSIKLFAMVKISDSYLHPYQELRLMGGGLTRSSTNTFREEAAPESEDPERLKSCMLYTECLCPPLQFISVQFSCSVVSDSLRPHESQHARPPCPSRTPGVHSDSCPLSQ